MVWKCSKCSYKTSSYTAMLRHYFKKHHKAKDNSKSLSKGKQKKIYTFHPKVGK